MSYKTISILLVCFSLIAKVNADTVYLKNGRSLEGIIKSENENNVELDLGFGTAKFYKEQIERIDKSTPDETEAIYQKWEKKKLEQGQKKLEQEKQPKDVKIYQEGGHIVADTILNNNIMASLVLDTGASFVVLSNRIAQQLNIDIDNIKETVQLQLADGRKIDAKHAILESIKVQDVEAKNVDVAILSDELPDSGFKDGLLGMSFLNRFNFKVDQQNKKLILEKLE